MILEEHEGLVFYNISKTLEGLVVYTVTMSNDSKSHMKALYLQFSHDPKKHECLLLYNVSCDSMKHKWYRIGYFCTYAPRLNISLKKNTMTLKFDLDLPVAVF